MPFFVIAGKPDCKHLVQAIHVATHLEKNLSNFKAKIVKKKPKGWATLLHHVNKKYNWTHTTSPIIWKELCRTGSKPYLIGGLSEFWEYVDDYYGLEAKIPKEMIKILVEESVQKYKKNQQILKNVFSDYTNILITGAIDRIILVLLPELINFEPFKKVNIFLHDRDPAFFRSSFMDDVIEDVGNMCLTVTIVESLREALKCCDLFLILENMPIKEDEETVRWLDRNIAYTGELADIINKYATTDVRIIVCQDGPSCLNATVLCEECHPLIRRNIVVVTSHLGLAPLAKVCEEAKIELADVGAPPVWGFIGLNKFVDLGQAVIKADVYKPYNRAVRSGPESTLPLGTVHSELRFLNYIIDDLELDPSLEAMIKEDKIKTTMDTNNYRKTRAIMSILKIWYSEKPNRDVISLGTKSDGISFGIPEGIVFSQPAICDNGHWVPYKEFPVTKKTLSIIQQQIKPTKVLLEEFRIQTHSMQSLYLINII